MQPYQFDGVENKSNHNENNYRLMFLFYWLIHLNALACVNTDLYTKKVGWFGVHLEKQKQNSNIIIRMTNQGKGKSRLDEQFCTCV